jgi:RecG-like helicase
MVQRPPVMVHPDHIALASEADKLPLVEPVYPLTAGLSGKVLRRAIGQSLERLPTLPEWLDADVMRRQSFPSFAAADLAKPERMLRLLQGDVGSGKTVVALLAMAAAVEAGGRPR